MLVLSLTAKASPDFMVDVERLQIQQGSNA
jgi:hypothetical protein